MLHLESRRQENLLGIAWMIASMAAFSIEDAFLKTVTKQVPVGQVLMMFGAGGLCIFAIMARRMARREGPAFSATGFHAKHVDQSCV
jgi:drug/metabolite transporter (DMT)-like permease